MNNQINKYTNKQITKEHGPLKHIRRALVLIILLLFIVNIVNRLPLKEIWQAKQVKAAVKYVITSNDSVSGLTATGILSIGSSLVDGFLQFFPTLNAPTTTEGNMYYDKSAHKVKYYNGSFWQTLAANADFTCPTNWIAVPADSTLGTTGFCVMKYEAKQDSNKNPISQPTGTPWVSVDWYEAREACKRAGAHLITSNEWTTIARNIEATTINDLDDDAGLQLATGHSDNAPGNSLATTAGADPVVSGCTLTSTMENASNAYSAGSCEIRGTGSGGSTDNDKGYYGTGQQWSATGYSAGAANKSQLRTAVLSNGQVIWDFAGDVWEWNDWQCGTSVWYNSAAWIDWTDANLTGYLKYAAGPSGSLTSANGAGQYYGCGANGNAAFRGGAWDSGALGGPFPLALFSAPSFVSTSVGFRCAK
ncbi:MAG: hypothetical protein M1120_03285 [Patescibacteria group bacterium]|nr:hypothetical protein [Patescibacteria group bacterium]